MTHKVYQYLPDLKVLREKAEVEKPTMRYSEDSNGMKYIDPYQKNLQKEAMEHYERHLASLTTYPASGFGKEHEGRDLVEGKDFKIDKESHEGCLLGGKCTCNNLIYVGCQNSIKAAVPLEAEAEKQEFEKYPELANELLFFANHVSAPVSRWNNLLNQVNIALRKAQTDDRQRNVKVNADLVTTFATFDEWVNKASSRLKGFGRYDTLIAVDKNGNHCKIGEDFMKCRDEQWFPVSVYLLKRSINNL